MLISVLKCWWENKMTVERDITNYEWRNETMVERDGIGRKPVADEMTVTRMTERDADRRREWWTRRDDWRIFCFACLSSRSHQGYGMRHLV